MKQIAAVLDGLKQKIDHGSTFIQRSYNSIGQARSICQNRSDRKHFKRSKPSSSNRYQVNIRLFSNCMTEQNCSC
ncbi:MULTISPECIES: hypothetical protein [unclassified Exiguobacterium]|uniref:hypothetical protein n=1 Tax=unclassified Exiguobacterium TaxID=2644629 RepID=UPI003335D5F8